MAFSFGYPNVPPDRRGWGPGFPECQNAKMVPLVAAGVSFGSCRGEVHDLLELLITETDRRGYGPKMGQVGCFVCRCSHKSDGSCAKDSAGREIPSNHSWGLAVDYNWRENVYGADRSTSAIATRHRWMPALWKTYGFRWLGPPISDWQHFDFAGNVADAKHMTDKARRDLGGGDDDVNLDKYVDGEQAYRSKLKELGKDPGPAKDDWDEYKKAGWTSARFAAQNPKAAG